MNDLLRGQVAVVTGGASGIGLAVSHRFMDEGAIVVIADIDGDACDVASEGRGEAALPLQMDVSDEASIERGLAHVLDRLGRVDVLVVNAGILHLGPVIETPPDVWRRVVDVNLTGAYLTCRAFAPVMAAAGKGSIIMTSSLFGVRGGRDNGAYSASKFGMVGLMQCLAAEMAPHGVTVNAVCPGQVETEMIGKLVRERAAARGISESAVQHDLLARVPMGRMASPEEVAGVYLFLASPLSRYLTGQAVVVDGGIQVG